MASCISEMNHDLEICRSPPSEKMTRGKERAVGSAPDAREASPPSPCSSTDSSWSSANLERRVNQEANKDCILDKVRALQQEVAALKSEISEERADAGNVKIRLEKMLQEHAVLASSVSTAAVALENFNRQCSGRAAGLIATCQASLGTELRVLGENLSALEEILRSGRGLLWSSRLHPPPTGSNCLSIKTDKARDIPIAQSNGSMPKNDGHESSPRLPDIYLTPSRPVYSSESPPSSSNHSPVSESNSSIPHSSPLSSLPNLDPFTPDTISAPPMRDHSGVYSGVSTSLTPLGQPTNKNVVSPQMLVGGDCGRGSSSTSVLQWLMSSSHQVEVEEEEEEGCDGGGWRGGEGEREREKFSPADSEVVETATAAVASSVSTLSPPVSSPCADSGISSSNHSSHLPTSLPPFTGHHYTNLPPPTLSVTIPLHSTRSDIEAMKEELARLKEEIRNTSNWCPSLSQDHSIPPTTSLSVPPPATWSLPPSSHGHLSSGSGFKQKFSTATPLELTPTVPRPFQSVSKSHSHVSRTPRPGTSSLSSHRCLFSSRQTATPPDQQPRPQLVDQSVQTMPITNTRPGTKSWNRTEPIYHLHSTSPFTSHRHTATTTSHPLSPHLPPNFTPQFVVRTSHPPSLHTLSSLSPHTNLHTSSSSSHLQGHQATVATSHLSPWL